MRPRGDADLGPSVTSKSWDPTWDACAKNVVLGAKHSFEGRLFIAYDKKVTAKPKQGSIDEETPIAKQESLPKDNSGYGYIHGIAHVPVKTRHDQLLWRRDRRWRAQSLQREARERVDEAWYTGQNQQHADTAR